MSQSESQSFKNHKIYDRQNIVDCMLVTANVGSLFEDPTRLLQPWLEEFLRKVDQLQPHFIALHLQEVGGKTYEKSMEYVQEFIRRLCEANEMEEFTSLRIYMDEDFNSAEHFTALGNLYFVNTQQLQQVQIWNFIVREWESVNDKMIYSGNIESIATKEKAKFPQHFFPECKWSRKGFMRTRWEINGTIIDLANIHLFHDASNLAACEEFPSVYCKTRRRALVHTLERFHLDDKNGSAPYFLFGDFNFRCDTAGVIRELTENLTVHRIQSVKSDTIKVHYRNSTGDNVLTIGKKEFNYADHQLKFKEDWLKKFDRELEALGEVLVEYPIRFPPSYPYEEDPEMPTDYMSTRCPSWCDRILMSPQTKEIISDEDIENPYGIIGENVCMGDHKPIYLKIHLKPNQGTYRCCDCVSNKLNNRQSTSRPNPTVTVDIGSENKHYYCPYKCQAYCKVLFDSNHEHNLNNNNEIKTVDEPSTRPAIDLPFANHKESSPIGNSSEYSVVKRPSVSINLIDSDNLHVCMCSHSSSASNDKIDEENGKNGTICSECKNIIRRHPGEHRYRLISKRLLLSNNIIVNRIDTQYLNTPSSDASSLRQDPYTPESAESHSPCPELNSNGSSSSSNDSQSPLDERMGAGVQQNIDDTTISTKEITGDSVMHANHNSKVQDGSGGGGIGVGVGILERHQRGVVTPGQLKSRLEDLQRSSMNSLYQETAGTVGDGDVDCVDIENNATHRRSNTRFRNCCNIH